MKDIGLLEIDYQFWYYGTIAWIDLFQYLLVNDASLLHKTQWLTNVMPIGIVIKLTIILMFYKFRNWLSVNQSFEVMCKRKCTTKMEMV